MLKRFGEEIWIVDSAPSATSGFGCARRMVVIRLSNGDLFVWSPSVLSNELRKAVDALGEVRHLVEPNALHDQVLNDWRRVYASAKLYAPPGLRERRKDMIFDGDLGDEPAAAWADEIGQVVVRGNLITAEVVFFHRKSGTALFADLIQYLQANWDAGWRGRMERLFKTEPTVLEKFRVATTDRAAARASINRIVGWPTDKVLLARGDPIMRDGRAFIERAFRWLGH